MAYVPVGAAKVHYEVVGASGAVEGAGKEGAASPALVMVHGTGSAGAAVNWGQTAPLFAGDRPVVLPDLSGTDKTADDGGVLSVEVLALQVIAVIEAAARGPVDLLGFSLGATVVVKVAALRPDLVRRLIVVAGWAHTEGDEYLRNGFGLWRSLGRTPGQEDAFGRLITITGFSGGFLNSIGRDGVEALVPNLPPTEGTLRHVEADLSVDIREDLPLVAAPTLVIGATQDFTVPVQHSRALHEAIAGSEYAELDAGHVMFFERPEEFADVVGEFIRR
ncbi:alpha/beta fold hydrolase [Actinorhabdospora filicis]|nr:alpha/beta hydrolase [Actinorhabdospora filicis]